jgi:hypothetical protein
VICCSGYETERRSDDFSASADSERHNGNQKGFCPARHRRAVLRCRPQVDFDPAATQWDGPVLSEHLRRRCGVDLGVRYCQRRTRAGLWAIRAMMHPVVNAATFRTFLRRLLRRAGGDAEADRSALKMPLDG